ncbi:MAG TPA: hypothetical protein DHW65_02070 [Dehalococcoidia bacterium]|nr:hypothetical protein [Chloroflexota bacterium]MQF95223.1 hypothetical protein [SAR202 cluster bacterium]HAA95418.1 hypothetical protein [Dehalococcoidia bacterium]HCL25119.1 hypothetical protein [Dehalococcoidia bacterium]|tara:strand:+ start:4687 stop:4917 length:231 start_codon:yes stop_codon:yes gene_type:complete
MGALVGFILAHSGESADPELLHWIKERLDQIFGSGPWVVVILMTAIIFAMPLTVAAVYLLQSKRRAAAEMSERDIT